MRRDERLRLGGAGWRRGRPLARVAPTRGDLGRAGAAGAAAREATQPAKHRRRRRLGRHPHARRGRRACDGSRERHEARATTTDAPAASTMAADRDRRMGGRQQAVVDRDRRRLQTMEPRRDRSGPTREDRRGEMLIDPFVDRERRLDRVDLDHRHRGPEVVALDDRRIGIGVRDRHRPHPRAAGSLDRPRQRAAACGKRLLDDRPHPLCGVFVDQAPRPRRGGERRERRKERRHRGPLDENSPRRHAGLARIHLDRLPQHPRG